MSALDGWIDVCRTGTWTDSQSRETTLTDADFDEMVTAFDGGDPVPVVVGHPDLDAPAYAWVEGLRRVGDRLQARLRDIMPAFRAAVEEGRYTGRSIATVGNALVHIGFLGGRGPAVPGLAPTQFNRAADRVIALAAHDISPSNAIAQLARIIARLVQYNRDKMIEAEDIAAADMAYPQYLIDSIKHIADNVTGTDDGMYNGYAAAQRGNANMPDDQKTQPDEVALATRAAQLDARAAELDKRETALDEREAKAEEDRALAAATAAVDAATQAGKLTPAMREWGLALAKSDAKAFAAYVEAAPQVLEPGAQKTAEVRKTLAAAEENEAIAAEARALCQDAAARGETLSSVQAVKLARAKRGLSN